MSERPFHEFQYGDVRASIWLNGREHATQYHVTFQRMYRHGNAWLGATGFRLLDLPVLAFTADQAYWWLRQREEAEKAAKGEASHAVVPLDPETVALFRPSAKLTEHLDGRPL